eukprot:TRINITY_DN23655_c0_g1_i1.p1 TRINITY_DN23655_c0_g1~~TRINITY_DN23655_c0_g1_i1.p1  ORF type:complete len:729 (+),score=157.43 TRINITY_DN23655_c0_g1_i1:171-2357(+)
MRLARGDRCEPARSASICRASRADGARCSAASSADREVEAARSFRGDPCESARSAASRRGSAADGARSSAASSADRETEAARSAFGEIARRGRLEMTRLSAPAGLLPRPAATAPFRRLRRRLKRRMSLLLALLAGSTCFLGAVEGGAADAELPSARAGAAAAAGAPAARQADDGRSAPEIMALLVDGDMALERLVTRLLSCGSVRQCLLCWSFLVEFALFPAFYRETPDSRLFGVSLAALRVAAPLLHRQAVGRAGHHATVEGYTRGNIQAVRDGLIFEQRAADYEEGRAPASRSALLVHFAPPSAAAAREAQPFVDLLRCFAQRQGMVFEHAVDPGLRFAWVGKVPVGVDKQDTYVVRLLDSAAALSPTQSRKELLAAVNISYLVQQLDDLRLDTAHLLHRLARRPVWRQIERSLDIVSGNPIRWAKVQAISDALDRNDAVVYVDYDMTVRVDCLGAARLLDVLFAPTWKGTKPSIVVRDSPTGIDCMNTGFVAFRSTGVARAFLKQWRAKLSWPGVLHADQGAFAETLLEFIHMEYKMAGLDSGYYSGCLEFLVASYKGWRSWRDYCDCFQVSLAKLAGDFANRDLVHVRFVDPRDIDVNFVPNSLAPAHMSDVRRMRLVAPRPSAAPAEKKAVQDNGAVAAVGEPAVERAEQVLSPLFVHFAGIPNRTRLMREYLVRRFGVRPTWFRAERSAAERCQALAHLSPRKVASCAPGVGLLGTDIENVW